MVSVDNERDGANSYLEIIMNIKYLRMVVNSFLRGAREGGKKIFHDQRVKNRRNCCLIKINDI